MTTKTTRRRSLSIGDVSTGAISVATAPTVTSNASLLGTHQTKGRRLSHTKPTEEIDTITETSPSTATGPTITNIDLFQISSSGKSTLSSSADISPDSSPEVSVFVNEPENDSDENIFTGLISNRCKIKEEATLRRHPKNQQRQTLCMSPNNFSSLLISKLITNPRMKNKDTRDKSGYSCLPTDKSTSPERKATPYCALLALQPTRLFFSRDYRYPKTTQAFSFSTFTTNPKTKTTENATNNSTNNASNTTTEERPRGGKNTRKRLASTCRRDYVAGHLALRRGQYHEALAKLHQSLRAYLPLRGADDIEVAAVHELLGAAHVRMIENTDEVLDHNPQQRGLSQNGHFTTSLGGTDYTSSSTMSSSDEYHREKALMHYHTVLRILGALERDQRECREFKQRQRIDRLQRKQKRLVAASADHSNQTGDQTPQEVEPTTQTNNKQGLAAILNKNDRKARSDFKHTVELMTKAQRGGFATDLDDDCDDDGDQNNPLSTYFGEQRNGGKDFPASYLPRMLSRQFSVSDCGQLMMPPAPPALTPTSSFRRNNHQIDNQEEQEETDGYEPKDSSDTSVASETSISSSSQSIGSSSRARQRHRRRVRFRRYFDTITNVNDMRRRASFSLDALEGKTSDMIEF